MIIVWDEPKRLKNIERHGLDFRDAERINWPDAVIEPSYPGPQAGLDTVPLVFSTTVSWRPCSRCSVRRGFL